MKFQFRVDGDLPPKKDGASSMWGKASEFKRLVQLRRAARKALGDHPPLRRNIRLSLVVCVGHQHTPYSGDLDNFITGICDGLQAAHPGTPLKFWSDPALAEIHPRRPIAIVDDSAVTSIRAEKRFGDGNDWWYEVVLQAEE